MFVEYVFENLIYHCYFEPIRRNDTLIRITGTNIRKTKKCMHSRNRMNSFAENYAIINPKLIYANY